ncbi:MAG: ArsR/SmtB family transcription factor [Actinomycetes bacterium]
MRRRAAKDALFEALAGAARALASGRRAEIVDVLSQGERSVEEIAREVGQSLANTSHHLRTLARAGLVSTRRNGTRIHYRLAGDRVAELWSALRDVSVAQDPEIDSLAEAYLGDRGALRSVDRTELAALVEQGRVVVIDVRPAAEYAAGHIAGARSVPPDEVGRRLEELPEDAEVVAYYRGPYCVYADDAVRALIGAGRRARRLEDGFPEWRRAGLPVAVGEGRWP